MIPVTCWLVVMPSLLLGTSRTVLLYNASAMDVAHEASFVFWLVFVLTFAEQGKSSSPSKYTKTLFQVFLYIMIQNPRKPGVFFMQN